MWNSKKIEFKNLFAHKHSIYEFKNNICTVIFGKNEDDKGLDNNGSGKSTLIEAICIALTNSSLRSEVSKDDFINIEAEECEISYELENAVLRQKLKIVRRYFRGNKTNKVELFINDEKQKQITSSNEANKKIFELIGISKDDLIRYYIISQDNKYAFLTAGDSEKKEIMNRITSADSINPLLDELNVRYKEASIEYSELDSEIEQLNYKIGILTEQKEELIASSDYKGEVKRLRSEIVELEADITNKKSLKIKNEKLIKDYSKDLEIKRKKIKDPRKIKADIKRLKSEVEHLDEEICLADTTIRQISVDLDSVIVCPHCDGEFVKDPTFDISVEELKDTKSQVVKMKESYKSQRDKEQSNLKTLRDQLKTIESEEEEIYEIEEKINVLNRKIKRFNEDIKYNEDSIVKALSKIDKLKEKQRDDKALNSLNEKLSEAEKSSLEVTKKLDKKLEVINMIKFWQFHMGKTGFSTYLANKSVKIIEGITNSFLKKFGVDFSIMINGFTVLKSGEVREKINVFVQSDGVTAKSFMSHSGGERGRINVACILGMQHLLNLSTDGRGLNLLCLDESFPGIDAMGQENIIKILEKVGSTIIMITQQVNDSFNNDNTLRVLKSNGVASYVDSFQS